MAMDPEMLVPILQKAGLTCEWDMGSGSPRLRVDLPAAPGVADQPLEVYLTEAAGHNGFWRCGNTLLLYKGHQLSPLQRQQMQELVTVLQEPLASPLDWSNAGPMEERLGAIRLRPVNSTQGRQEWLLLIPSPCQQSCIFCNRSFGYRLEHEKALKPVQEQATLLQHLLKQGRIPPQTRVTIGGHEPLTFTGLSALFEVLASNDCLPHRLQTAGWPITAKQIQELAGLGLKEVDIPLYSHLPQIHDQIVACEDAYEKTLEGVACFKSQGVKLVSHTVLLQQNLAHLADLVNLVRRLGFTGFTLRFPTEVPSSEWRGRRLTPSLRETRQALQQMPQELLMGDFLRITLPPCVLPSGWETRFFAPEASPEQFFPPPCVSCAARSRCTGLGASYTTMHGEQDIHPLMEGC